jgi:hypothetical protein
VPIKNTLLNLEKRLQKLAGERAPTEPIEIRQAVLDAIADLARPTGRGKRVLPCDRVEIEVLAPTTERRREFEAVLDRDGSFAETVRKSLAASGCELPRGFAIAVHFRRKPPVGWGEGQHFAVSGRASESRAQGTPALKGRPAREDIGRAVGSDAPGGEATPIPLLPLVSLKVVKGRAARRTVEVRAERINIGRQEEVSDRDRRLVRRNHVAFSEGDETSATVSRAHAHIRCAGGECRLHDEGSAYGTRIDRGGRMIDVTPGGGRGVRLQHGDVLHVGRAVIEVGIG